MDEAEARAEELRTEIDRLRKDLLSALRKNSTEAGEQGRLSAVELKSTALEQALMKLAELSLKQDESLNSKVDQLLISNQMLQKSMDQSLSAAVRNLLPEIRSMISSTTNPLKDELTRGTSALNQAANGFQNASVNMEAKFRELTDRRNRIDGIVGVAGCATVLLVSWHFAALRNFFNHNFPLFWWLTVGVLAVMCAWLFGFFHFVWRRWGP